MSSMVGCRIGVARQMQMLSISLHTFFDLLAQLSLLAMLKAVRYSFCASVQYPRVANQNFNISSNVFKASQIPFSPKTTYVQQTLDFTQVLPLYNQVIPPHESLPTSLTLYMLVFLEACPSHDRGGSSL